MDEFIKLRLKDIEDNINQDQDLLREYQKALRYEDDPRRLAKYKQEIERQQKSVIAYQKEYDELKKQMPENPPIEAIRIENLIGTAISKLDSLSRSQADFHEEMLSHFDISEQKMMNAIINRIDENQFNEMQAVLKAIEANSVPDEELKTAMIEMQKSVEAIEEQNKNPSASDESKNLGSLSKVIKDSNVDSSQKLKYSIPLIPAILSYEGEIELKNGFDLRMAWDRLVSKVMSK